jgi:hypothetical protein
MNIAVFGFLCVLVIVAFLFIRRKLLILVKRFGFLASESSGSDSWRPKGSAKISVTSRMKWPQSDVYFYSDYADSLISKLETLQENWDSYGGIPPTSQSLKTARTILSVLSDLPACVPTSDGGVQLEWTTAAGDEVIISISPSGEISGLVNYDVQNYDVQVDF